MKFQRLHIYKVWLKRKPPAWLWWRKWMTEAGERGFGENGWEALLR